MQTIKVKLPKKQQNVGENFQSSIIKEIIPEIEYYQFEVLEREDPQSDEISNFQDILEEFNQNLIVRKPKDKKKVERPTFAAYFSIKNLNKLVELDLSKVNKVELSSEEIQMQVQSAYDKGFEDGQQVTQMAVAEEFHKLENWVKRIDEVIKNLRIEFSNQLEKLKEAIVPISIKIAETILNNEIKTNPIVIEKQIEKALKIIDNETIFQLRLNPSDLEILKNVGSKLLSDPKLEEVETIADPTIEPGGCILETEVGKIDATIQSQLKKIESALKNYSFGFEEENV
ncbi:MAG: FliH/SctL family protein [Ignavibacteria bacterium]|nr:FliH/SctL family protein [Ignavibacteria bacterium]